MAGGWCSPLGTLNPAVLLCLPALFTSQPSAWRWRTCTNLATKPWWDSAVLLQKDPFPHTFHPIWKKFVHLSVQGSFCQHWKGWLHSTPGHPRQIFFWFFNNGENLGKPQESEFPFLDMFVQPCQLYLHTVSTSRSRLLGKMNQKNLKNMID